MDFVPVIGYLNGPQMTNYEFIQEIQIELLLPVIFKDIENCI